MQRTRSAPRRCILRGSEPRGTIRPAVVAQARQQSIRGREGEHITYTQACSRVPPSNVENAARVGASLHDGPRSRCHSAVRLVWRARSAGLGQRHCPGVAAVEDRILSRGTRRSRLLGKEVGGELRAAPAPASTPRQAAWTCRSLPARSLAADFFRRLYQLATSIAEALHPFATRVNPKPMTATEAWDHFAERDPTIERTPACAAPSVCST